MRRSVALGLTSLVAFAACSKPPPAAQPEPQTPTVSTEPPVTPAMAVDPEPTCPEGQRPTPNGCEPAEAVEKIDECNRLIASINDEQGQLMKRGQGSDPEALRGLAGLLEGIGGRLGALQLAEPTLRDFRDDYATMVTELAAAARRTAKALDDNDPQSAARAAKEMSQFGARESQLVDELNRYCSGEAADSASVAGAAPPAPDAKGPFPASTHPAMTNPALARSKAPPHFAVRFDTTVGSFTVKCDRSWAPHGADRFYNLVSIGYFDDVAFFRAVKGFVIQFGIHGDPAVNKAWKKANITPDVVKVGNDEGTLTFAQAGQPAAPGKTADTRNAQLFFNLTDNTRLDAMGFAPLCKVTSGLDVVKSIHTGHGEQAGRDQSNIQSQGNPYLRSKYPGLDYIERARLVGP